MPNDCINSFTITDLTDDQWRTLSASFQTNDEDHQQSFLKTFFPEPDWQNTPNDKGELPSTLDKNGISHFPDGSQDIRWYEWRNKHWGTKWDVYSCCLDQKGEDPSDIFSVNFCTAWAPLNEECMAVLSENFPNSILTNYYHEEGSDFYGVTIAKDGEALDVCNSISEHREAFLRQQFPDLDARLKEEGLDPEEDLEEFFWNYCDDGSFVEYLYDSLAPALEEMIQEVVGKSEDNSATSFT